MLKQLGMCTTTRLFRGFKHRLPEPSMGMNRSKEV